MTGDHPSALPPPGRPRGFIELSSEDLTSTRAFLEKVFGWNFRPASSTEEGALEFHTPDGIQGGVHPVGPGETPSARSLVRVSDLGSTLERVREAGGVLVLPRVELPGQGSFFTFQVPGGPFLTCWQGAPPPAKRR